MVVEKRHSWLECSKPHCPEENSYYVSELEKLYPDFKEELDNWREKNGSAICDKHWKELKINKKRKEQTNREHQQRNYRSSHCRHCNKSSLIYHYIYNIYTHKVDSSFSNATNPDHQLVFCNQTCFNNHFPCKNCKKREVGIIAGKGKDSIFFCSNNCLEGYKRKKKDAELDELLREREELQQELDDLEEKNKYTCDQCGTKKNDGNYFYNQVTNDGKKFCSSECFNNHYAEACDKCSKKIGTSEKSYYQDAKSKSGTLCQSCWESKKNRSNSNPNQGNIEEKKENNYTPVSSSNSPSQNGNSNSSGGSSNGSSFSPSFLNNNSSNDEDIFSMTCGVCSKTFLGEEAGDHEKNSSCAAKTKTLEEIYKKVEGGLKITKKEVDNLYEGTNMAPEKKQFLQYVQRISQGEHINIESLNLPEEAKKELRRIQEIYNSREDISSSDNIETGFERHLGKIVVGGIFTFLVLILLIIVIRRKRTKKKK